MFEGQFRFVKRETDILYGVFDYGDEPQVNEIRGRAIIRQLVCSGYCYSMLMLRDPIDPSRRERAVRERRNRFQTQPNRESTPTLPLFFAGQRGDVARRSRLWNATSPDPSCTDRSNLSSVYHRNKSMGSKKEKGRATRREEEKKGERGRENIKEEIALSHHWLLVIFLESICMRKNCDFACGSRGCRLRSIPCNIRQEVIINFEYNN